MKRLKQRYFIYVAAIVLLLTGLNIICIMAGNIWGEYELTFCVAIAYTLIETITLAVSVKSYINNSFNPKKHIFSDVAVLNTISLTSALALDSLSSYIDEVFPFDIISIAVVSILSIAGTAVLTAVFVISLLALLSKFLKKEKVSIEKGAIVAATVSVALSIIISLILGYPEILLTIPLTTGIAVLNIQLNRAVNEMYKLNDIFS